MAPGARVGVAIGRDVGVEVAVGAVVWVAVGVDVGWGVCVGVGVAAGQPPPRTICQITTPATAIRINKNAK